MTENIFVPKLRPNTFVLLLLRATRSEFSNSPTWGKSSNGLVRSKLFTALMRVTNPTYSPASAETLSQYISKFLDGSRPYSPTYYPFKDAAFQSTVTLRMEEDYTGALNAMKYLCDTYLDMANPTAIRLLVGGIIETILADASFADTLIFHGRQIDKASLAELEEVSLLPFLVDVWTLIVMAHHNSEEATDTYKHWTADDRRSGSPRTITSRIGENMAKKITVSTELPEEASEDTVIENETDTSEHDGQPIILETAQEHGDGDVKQQTLNHHGNLFIQHAEKITNIGHVETLYI